MNSAISPVEVIDRAGSKHLFAMTFGARRRIMRRLRALMLRGELDQDMEKISPIDNLEIAYLTLWECMLGDRTGTEDAFLERFTDISIAEGANQLWSRYQGERVDPTQPETAIVASAPSETKTINGSVSGDAG